MGEWVLRTTCRQAKAWFEQGLDIGRMAVNLSNRQFNDPELLNRITGALRDSDLEPSRLELEITESCLIQDYHAAVSVSEQLKALGVHIALDDFGTGYSSMHYLKRFALDTMKIDPAFVKELPDDVNGIAIINAIIALARSLGARVVAEGVESREQFNRLRSQGDISAQGFLMCPPQPAEDVARYLARIIHHRDTEQ